MKIFSIQILFKDHPSVMTPILQACHDLDQIDNLDKSRVINFLESTSKLVVERTDRCMRSSVKEKEYPCHIYVRGDQMAAVLFSDQEYPNRVAQTVLSKLLDEFSVSYPVQMCLSMGENSANCGRVPEYLAKYQDPQICKQNDLDETEIILDLETNPNIPEHQLRINACKKEIEELKSKNQLLLTKRQENADKYFNEIKSLQAKNEIMETELTKAQDSLSDFKKKSAGHGRLQLDVMDHLKNLHFKKMHEPLTVEDINEALQADLHPDSMEFLRKDFLPFNEKVEMSSGPKFRFKPKYQFGNATELHTLLLDLCDSGQPCVLEEDLMEAYAKAGRALKDLKARENVLLPDYVRKDKRVVIMVVPRDVVDQERLSEDDPIRVLLNSQI